MKYCCYNVDHDDVQTKLSFVSTESNSEYKGEAIANGRVPQRCDRYP